MRWKGLIFLSVLVVLIFILSLIFTDKWLENKFEDIGTSIVGAKVDIDNLDFSFTGLRIGWERLQVTDPAHTMKNIIETGKTEFDMEFIPLLSGKVIIESIMLTGLRSGTDRETDGHVEKEKSPISDSFIGKTASRLEQEVTSNIGEQIIALKQNVNVDSIIKILQIESLDKMKSLESSLSSKYTVWSQKLNQINIEQDTREIEQKIKTLDVNRAKSIDGFQSTLNDIENIRAKINKMNTLVNDTKNDLQSDLSAAGDSLSKIDDWIAADYKRAMSMAKLPELNAQNIGKLIFGPRLTGQVNQYLAYIGMARNYADRYSSDEPKKKDPPRLKGQTIYFPGHKADPDFWIKKIELSGMTKAELEVNGNVKNLVSEQKLTGNPTEFRIGGGTKGKINLNMQGIFNYLQEEPQETIDITYSGFSLAGTRLSDSKLLPNQVKKGTGAISGELNLRGESINGLIKFRALNLQFDLSPENKAKNKFEEIVHSIIAGIKDINFTARIDGRADDLKFSLNSNLDDIFAQQLKNIIGKEIEAAKSKIKTEIDQKISGQRKEMDRLVSEKEQQLTGEIKKYQDLVDQNMALLDTKKKEVEKIFEKEKSKVQDKVKDLFKF